MTILEVIKYIENHGCISDEVKDITIRVLEMQIAHKVEDYGICPDCCHDFGAETVNYCPRCGQKLDRSE